MAQNTEEIQKFPKIAWPSLPSSTVDSKGQSWPQSQAALIKVQSLACTLAT